MGPNFDAWIRTGVYRAAVVLCVFLILLTGFIAAVHFHSDAPQMSDHSCSVCALAHAGVVPVELLLQAPILVPSLFSGASSESSHSLLLVILQVVRPPPLA